MRYFLKRITAIALVMLLLLQTLPTAKGAGAIEKNYEIGANFKVFRLTEANTSSNGKTVAEYLAFDGQTGKLYVLFTSRRDKPITEAGFSLAKDGKETALSVHDTSYETVTIEGNTLSPKPRSDGKYYWQIADCSYNEFVGNTDIFLTATTPAGGFSINGVQYTLNMTYGLKATKKVMAINEEPVAADDVPIVDVGDTILWHITIENAGDFALSGITLDDKLEGAWLTNPDGTEFREDEEFSLNPGEQKVIEARYVVKPEDAGTTVINVIAATSGGGMVEAGSSDESYITYTVTYDPNGGVDAPDLQIKDQDVTVSLHEKVPTRDGYLFDGWNTEPDGSGEEYIPGADYSENENLKLYAQWIDLQCAVVFHANNPDYTGDDVFRTYYKYHDMPYMLNADNTITAFYDIPQFDYLTHNRYVFSGWYTEPDETGVPISWQQVYDLAPGEEVHIYAHWLETGTVAQEEDGKAAVGSYNGFDLVGTQVRTVLKDKQEHYGDADSGLRFITVLSEELWAGIKSINAQNDAAAQYGFLLCKEATAQRYNADQLQYKAANSNGQDTTKSHEFLNNVKCNGVTDHFNGVGYRLYTMVVTYKNLEGAALDAAMAQKLVARSYIGYYDANGLYRYHYNNYTGDQIYHGCSGSYAAALALVNE